jgi:hypothetical protein
MVPEFKDIAHTRSTIVSPAIPSQSKGWVILGMVLVAMIIVFFCVFAMFRESSDDLGIAGALAIGGCSGIFWAAIALFLLRKAVSIFPAGLFERLPVEAVTEFYHETTNEKVGEHRCCIQCKHPIKALR